MINISSDDSCEIMVDKIEWFNCPIGIYESSDDERREMYEAKCKLIKLGIIDQYGFPSKMTIKEKLNMLPDDNPIKKEILKKIAKNKMMNNKKKKIKNKRKKRHK